jgi:uncharacterized protein (TIGR03032 family)
VTQKPKKTPAKKVAHKKPSVAAKKSVKVAPPKPATLKRVPRVRAETVASVKAEKPRGRPAPPTPSASPAAHAKLEIAASRQFVSWLAGINASLAFTTYRAGKVFLIGCQPDGRLSIFERTFNRCMGLCVAGNGFYMSSLFQLWRFENILDPGQAYNGYDRAYVPIVGYTTGDLDIHDMAVDGNGRIVFVNTLFSCLATVGERDSFAPLWRPPFVSKLAAEDRCHLNGLAMDDGKPAYVTAIASTDVTDGWRDKRTDGGCVIDVRNNQVIATGLSMPHSPRLHRGKLWLLNSGTGEFGIMDPKTGRFQPIAFCPGYLRGLSFIADYAVVGLSKPRENRTFTGLPLDDALARRNAEAQCAIYVIDLRTGDAVHWLRIEGIVEELYDVVVLAGVRRPMAFGFKTDEIRRVVKVGPPIGL